MVERQLVVRWVVGSIRHGGHIELFRVPGFTMVVVRTILSVGLCI